MSLVPFFNVKTFIICQKLTTKKNPVNGKPFLRFLDQISTNITSQQTQVKLKPETD